MRRLSIVFLLAIALTPVGPRTSPATSAATLRGDPIGAQQEHYWERTLGGPADEHFRGMLVTREGDFIATGMTSSTGQGSSDVWTVKLNQAGQALWEKTFGSDLQDWGESLTETSDSGFLVLGRAVLGAGGGDIWIVKLSAAGTIEWQMTYGGPDDDRVYQAHELSDGDFLIVGTTQSFGPGNRATLLMRIDSGGTLLWQKTYGAGGWDDVYRSVLTGDGGLLMMGDTGSYGQGINAWLLKVDADGNPEWQKTYQFGAAQDEFTSIRETSDGNWIVTGFTNSFGSHDALLVKLDHEGAIQWQKRYGGSETEYGSSAVQTADGNYVFAGWTASFGMGAYDGWIVATDQSGGILWERTYGGTGVDVFYALHGDASGQLTVFGETDSYGAGGFDLWILKLDSTGVISDCRTMGTSEALVTATSATVYTSTFGVFSSGVTTSTTSVIAEDAHSIPGLFCSYPVHNAFLPMTCIGTP